MAFDQHANLAITNVATAPSPALSGGSLTVTAGAGALFPAPGTGYECSVWPAGVAQTFANTEIVRVTARSTDTFTITRTIDGTNRAIAIGDQFALTVTKKSITDVEAVALGGTVTSVAATVPSILTVSGSPIVGAGTLAFALQTQAANLAFLGPISGTAATPAMRVVDPLDFASTWFPVTAQFDKTDVTLASVTGLSISLLAGKTYLLEADLLVLADAVGGQKYGIGGTFTATTLAGSITVDENGTLPGSTQFTAKGQIYNGGSAGSTSNQVRIFIYVVVNGAGTLTIQFAQNSANGTSSVLVGSTLKAR